jgi:predicted P-loop ATPase
MRGFWIIEMEEMSVARKSDADILKAFLTRRVDRVRLPYAHNAQLFPRQCVFIGTINETEYLRDSTGNRRFAPVACRRINVTGLNRDQLWAEARESWLANPDTDRLRLPERLWKEADKQQELRRLVDPLESKFLESVSKLFEDQNPGEFVTSEEIMLQSSLITIDEQRRGQRLLGAVLTRAGLVKTRRRVNGVPKHGWLLPEEEIDPHA